MPRKNSSSDKKKKDKKIESGGFAETMDTPVVDMAETVALPAGQVQQMADSGFEDTPITGTAKQEMDLAVAIAALRSGKVTERQLARVVQGWTAYGTQLLVDRLVAKQLVPHDEKDTLLADAKRRLQLATDLALKSGSLKESQAERQRLANLDSSGRITKLLGLNNSGSVIPGEPDRQLSSRFTLIRKLGEGGLGTVWLARDENLRRYVAIKEIRGRNKKETAAAVARFRREAEVTGRLEHPGIVPIYQFGRDSGSGRYFYAMRFLGKQTMQDKITEYHERREAGNDEPLLMHRLLTAFLKLCNSVAHAHSRKVVHRDLKPENVALDSFGQVVLLDWGLAKINDETGAAEAAVESGVDELNEASLTIASQVLGSPMYMAPEQAAGRVDDIDERTDVYGLGGILFAILTGQAPHEHSSDGEGSMSDLLDSIVSKPVLRAASINPHAPAKLDAICAKAMQKKQYLRYSGAAEIAEDVECYIAGGKVSAYDETYRERIMRWVTIHPKLSQLVGLLATLALVTIFGAGYSWRTTQITQNSFRFQRASDIAKELAFALQNEAESLVGDTRFLTALPPVQGIIDSTAKRSDEEEVVWTERMSSIYSELLRRHPSYLAIALMSHQDQVQQVVRCERNVGTNIVRRVPESLLKSFTEQQNGPDFDSMLPGDVSIRTSDQINKDAPARFRDPLSLTAANVIFDQVSGELFGITAIQIDLRTLLKDRIRSIGNDNASVFITDGQGVVQLAFQGGTFVDGKKGMPIADLIPSLSDMFSDNASLPTFSDDETVYARRILLGRDHADSQATVGIVIQLAQ